MTENVQLALIATIVPSITAIGVLIAVIRGNQDAKAAQDEAKRERGEANHKLDEIHKLTNSNLEAVTVKADQREKDNSIKNDERLKGLEDTIRQLIAKNGIKNPEPVSVKVENDKTEPVPTVTAEYDAK